MAKIEIETPNYVETAGLRSIKAQKLLWLTDLYTQELRHYKLFKISNLKNTHKERRFSHAKTALILKFDNLCYNLTG